MTAPLTAVTLTVQPDGFTVNGAATVAPGVGYAGIACAWGDGHVSEFRTPDPSMSHVYERAGTYGVVVSCRGSQVRKTVTTTTDTPRSKNRWPGTPPPLP